MPIVMHRVVVHYHGVMRLSECADSPNVDRPIAVFWNNDDNDPISPDSTGPNAYAIPRSEWIEMGRPITITVTVAPGDQLNPE